MKKYILILTGCLTLSIASSQKSVSFQAKSGDTELDASLTDINAKAKLDISIFKKDMTVDFGITSGKLDHLLLTLQPADVYMSLEIGKLVKKPVETVVTCYEKNKGKGWGVIAKEMGIKPGSKEFHELKNQAKGKKDKGNKGNGGKGKGGNAKEDDGDDESKEKEHGKGNSHGNGHGKNK
jgi:hypothetical protein